MYMQLLSPRSAPALAQACPTLSCIHSVMLLVLLSCVVVRPDLPASFTVDEITRAPGNVTITASWMIPPNFGRFDIDRYDINVSSTSGIQEMTIANGTSTNITLTVDENPSNVEQNTTFTMTIAAVNLCGVTGSVATASNSVTTPTPPATTPTTLTLTTGKYTSLLTEVTKVLF